MIVIKQMPKSAINRIGEIDRTEHATIGYEYRDGGLVKIDVDWRVPPWFPEGDGEHCIPVRIKKWGLLLEDNVGVMLGALDGDRLAGFGILRYRIEGDMAEFAVLHVSNKYRRQGIARRLSEEMFAHAIEDGAKSMYVSSSPTYATVSFYQSLGFRLADKVNKELYELEPEDIHMIKEFNKFDG